MCRPNRPLNKVLQIVEDWNRSKPVTNFTNLFNDLFNFACNEPHYLSKPFWDDARYGPCFHVIDLLLNNVTHLRNVVLKTPDDNTSSVVWDENGNPEIIANGDYNDSCCAMEEACKACGTCGAGERQTSACTARPRLPWLSR